MDESVAIEESGAGDCTGIDPVLVAERDCPGAVRGSGEEVAEVGKPVCGGRAALGPLGCVGVVGTDEAGPHVGEQFGVAEQVSCDHALTMRDEHSGLSWEWPSGGQFLDGCDDAVITTRGSGGVEVAGRVGWLVVAEFVLDGLPHGRLICHAPALGEVAGHRDLCRATDSAWSDRVGELEARSPAPATPLDTADWKLDRLLGRKQDAATDHAGLHPPAQDRPRSEQRRSVGGVDDPNLGHGRVGTFREADPGTAGSDHIDRVLVDVDGVKRNAAPGDGLPEGDAVNEMQQRCPFMR